jgi:hypothetical protein
MAEVVYVLCALTSVACAFLLLRGYLKTRVKLLFWSALCFIGLALNCVLLVADLMVFPTVDLSLWRSGVALASMLVLMIGLVGERI